MKTSVNESMAFSERRHLAVPEEILLSVEKPARYIGNEVNAASKDVNSVDVLFCMCFPDVYEIGMSHLGIQILYYMFNRREDVYCDRVYSPWPDMDKVMAEIGKIKNRVVFNSNEVAKKVNARSNMVLLGAAVPYLGIAMEKLEAAIHHIFDRKGEAVVQANLNAIHAGFEAAK